MSRTCFIGFFLALCLLGSCEKIDITDPEEETKEHIVPTSLGLGTQNSPYTVEQIQSGELSQKVSWFIGYVVGSTYNTMDHCIFEEETTYTSNILLSSNSTCDSIEECIPVELNSSTLKKALSLYYNSDKFRKCLIIKGRFGQYFRTNGIRDIREGYWLPNLDLSTLKNATPAEWQEWHEWY